MTSKEAYALIEKDFVWKPYYPNNMICNGVEGFYCLFPIKHRDDSVTVRKYTIIFQYPQNEDGFTLSEEEPELYILFEKIYSEINGNFEYPKPINNSCLDNCEDCGEVTFTHCDVNSFGRFIRAYKTIEEAKKSALMSFKMVYGYAMSFIEDSEE